MPHLDQNETYRNPQKFTAFRITKKHELSASSSPQGIAAQRAEDHLRHLATTDVLTGLANYRRLSEAVESEIKRSERTARAFSVLIFDVKGMKRINYSHGHL